MARSTVYRAVYNVFRKSHVLTGAAGAGTGYQVKIIVHYADGVDYVDNATSPPEAHVYCGGKCRADFGDIRFAGSDGITELDYLLYEAQTFYLAENAIRVGTYVNISPLAYYHNGKTYYAYQGPSLDPYVGYYDHVTKDVATPVQVGTNPLIDDAHGHPAIIRDDDGYIHVFYGSHSTAQKHAKSDNPDDISAWTAQADVSAVATYPNIVRTGADTFYVFFRGSAAPRDIVYKKTTDNFGSFGAETKIVDFATSVYPSSFEYDSANNRIHLTWFNWDDPNYRNVYHAYLDLSDGKMYSMDGTDLGATIDLAEADANCKVRTFASLTIQPFSTVHLNPSQVPYIIYFDGDFKFTKWTGAAWSAAVTIEAGTSAFSDFNITDADNIEAYLVKNDSKLYEFISADGGDSWDAGTLLLTYISPATDMWKPKIVANYQPEFKVLCGEHVVGYVTNVKVRGWGDSGELTITVGIFFVEVQEDLDTDKTIYVYYGKADETSVSNGENTFPWLFDDFDDYSINDTPNVTDWITNIDGDTITVQQDPADAAIKCFRMLESGDATPIGLYALLKAFRPSFAIHFRLRTSADTRIYAGATESDTLLSWIRRFQDTDRYQWHDGAAYTEFNPVQASLINTWYEMVFKLMDVGESYMHTDFDGTDKTGGFKEAPTVGADEFWFYAGGEVAVNIYVGGVGEDERYIFARKFVTPEPTHGAWGAEEDVAWPF